MFTTKPIESLPNPSPLPNPTIDPLPSFRQPVMVELEDMAGRAVEEARAHLPGPKEAAAELWNRLPDHEQGMLSHLAKSAEALCTSENLAKLGKGAQALGSLLTKGLIAQSPLGAFHILDPLLKDLAADSSMHLEASGSVAEGGPKTFQFNFGMTANLRKVLPSH